MLSAMNSEQQKVLSFAAVNHLSKPPSKWIYRYRFISILFILLFQGLLVVIILNNG